MDASKTGQLICELRKGRGLTQRQLAEQLCVSDKAVSKWERGMGSPDLSLLPPLSDFFGVPLESLLAGSLDANDLVEGNMRKLKFYSCPVCGNLMTATGEAALSCCGKKLASLEPCKAQPQEQLSVVLIENEYFVTSDHPMTKEHHISFVAMLTGDSLLLRKLYPEWTLQTRISRFGRGMLVWHCTNHGLFYQLL